MERVIYVLWNPDDVGITFNLSQGRITILKRTLEVIQFPEYYRFMFSPEDKAFAIQGCKMDDQGAHRLSISTRRKFRCDVKSMDLVRFVYETCGWDKKKSYRIQGTAKLDQQLVEFELAEALGIQEGHLLPPKRGRKGLIYKISSLDSGC